MIKTIRVPLAKRTYPIYVGSGAMHRIDHYVRQHKLGHHAIIVTQQNIWKHWKKNILESLARAHVEVHPHVISSRIKSEQAKSIDHFKDLLKKIAKVNQTGKDLFILALGGGVIGDLAGFAASVYKRGVPLIQVPTTLTAQVDSSIGGKNGVDIPEGKNLIGTIYQPKFVLVDPVFLSSLPTEVFSDGMAEVIKYGMIKDKSLLRYLHHHRNEIMERDDEACERIVMSSCKIKAAVVGKDEYDKKGIRAILNFGHTLGHAIEASSNYKAWTHGQAVAVGMLLACEIAFSLKVMKSKVIVSNLKKLIQSYGLPCVLSPEIKLDRVTKALLYDKKREKGQNRFILLRDIGRTMLYQNVPEQLIAQLLQKYAPGAKPSTKNNLLSRFFKVKKTSHSKKPLPKQKSSSDIGAVIAYYSKIRVAIIKITKGSIQAGDRVLIKGKQSQHSQLIKSMQINHKNVTRASKNDVIGIKVSKKVRQGDQVQLIA